MNPYFHYSLRLGFHTFHADEMKEQSLSKWVKNQIELPALTEFPEFMNNAPRTIEQVRDLRKETEEQKKILRKNEIGRLWKLQHWWLEKMYSGKNPLRERMTLFLHNHFVSSYQKVKISYLIYHQNQLFRDNAFGNLKEITRLVLHDNAMLLYLDNHQNKVKTPNENLARELLELFTLGIGNYGEMDIREAARALAGLAPGDNGGEYVAKWKDNGLKTILGKTGNFDVNDLVNIIFEQPKTGELFAEKLLKYFVSDTPEPNMIKEYHQLLVSANF